MAASTLRRRAKDSNHITLDAVARNIYTGPSQQYLEDHLYGIVEITDVEIRTGMTDEASFAALISARFRYALSEMAALMRTPTLPGHDEPAPDFLQNVWRIYG